jgi:hypothetical protein
MNNELTAIELNLRFLIERIGKIKIGDDTNYLVNTGLRDIEDKINEIESLVEEIEAVVEL